MLFSHFDFLYFPNVTKKLSGTILIQQGGLVSTNTFHFQDTPDKSYLNSDKQKQIDGFLEPLNERFFPLNQTLQAACKHPFHSWQSNDNRKTLHFHTIPGHTQQIYLLLLEPILVLSAFFLEDFSFQVELGIPFEPHQKQKCVLQRNVFSSTFTTSNFINVRKNQSARAGLLWANKLINSQIEIVKNLAEIQIAFSNQESK